MQCHVTIVTVTCTAPSNTHYTHTAVAVVVKPTHTPASIGARWAPSNSIHELTESQAAANQNNETPYNLSAMLSSCHTSCQPCSLHVTLLAGSKGRRCRNNAGVSTILFLINTMAWAKPIRQLTKFIILKANRSRIKAKRTSLLRVMQPSNHQMRE